MLSKRGGGRGGFGKVTMVSFGRLGLVGVLQPCGEGAAVFGGGGGLSW